ncbi:MAG: hypothetical protein HOV82_21930 [Streptomyces sp.]|nr:hypothetical protein [Streptomyces sp.]
MGLNSAMATVPTQDKGSDEIDFVRWFSQLEGNLAETLGGVLLRAARPVQVGDAAGAQNLASTSAGRLVGWSLREATGAAPGVVRIWDGRDNQGALLACINLGQGASETQWMAPGGVSFQHGCFVEIIAGGGLSADVEGAVFLGGAE